MIIDASTIVAVLLGETKAAKLTPLLEADAFCAAGAPSVAEAAVVLRARRGLQGLADLRDFLVRFDVHGAIFGKEHWRQAGAAHARYGKGRHPAGLSYGDCLTYAVAKLSGMPVLSAGDGFAQTDLELVQLGE